MAAAGISSLVAGLPPWPAHFLYLDEFPHYLNPDFERMVAMARSYRCGLVLAIQVTDQLLLSEAAAFSPSWSPQTTPAPRIGNATVTFTPVPCIGRHRPYPQLPRDLFQRRIEHGERDTILTAYRNRVLADLFFGRASSKGGWDWPMPWKRWKQLADGRGLGCYRRRKEEWGVCGANREPVCLSEHIGLPIGFPGKCVTTTAGATASRLQRAVLPLREWSDWPW